MAHVGQEIGFDFGGFLRHFFGSPQFFSGRLQRLIDALQFLFASGELTF
ncbi:MAG: hypothetical protein WBW54_05770 [Candidatus Acidiferrales bacterium]